MSNTAARLIDLVIAPDLTLRQWVLTVPFVLRLLLAARPEALSAIGRILRFYGVWGSHSHWRNRVVTAAPAHSSLCPPLKNPSCRRIGPNWSNHLVNRRELVRGVLAQP